MSESESDLKPVWVKRPVTVRAHADALATVKTFELIRDLVYMGHFLKVDTVVADDLAAELARKRRRKLEILEDPGADRLHIP